MENKVPDGSEDHIIIGIMILYVFLSRIARQHAFFQDLVLMRWRIYLGLGDARIPRHIMMVKKFEGGLPVGTLATRRELYSTTTLQQRVLSTYQIYGNFRRSST